ncbi:hypothetical protein EKI60_06410 [Candidatus Saccharibacteria bacterium]|nr:MAG: hypothetical protein EKI60_06410 [Candidatus Saccharibacteria bacterium]
MATFPTYNSQQNINANPAQVIREEASQPFKDQQKMLGTLQEITQKWSDANDVMQYTEAKAKHSTAIAQIQARAEADPNYKDSEKYYKELSSVNQEVLKGIDNKEVASKAGLEFNHDAQIAKIKIGANFRKKQLVANSSYVQTTLDGLYQSRVNVSDTEKLAIDDSINTTLNYQRQAGLMTDEEINEAVVKAQATGAMEGIFVNPDKTLQELKDKNGVYKDIPIEKRMSLIEKAQDYKKRLEKEQTELLKEVSFNNETEIILNIATTGRIPSATEMANMVKAGTMTADFAESALKAVTSPEAVDARTDGEEFSKLTMEIMKSPDKEALKKTINNILKGGGDGKISKADMQILVQSAIAQGKQKRDDITKAVISLGEWSDEAGLPRDQVFREYQKNISEGKDVATASDEAKKKVIVDNLIGASALDDVPNVIIGKDSKTRYIFNKNTNVSAHRIYQQDKAK